MKVTTRTTKLLERKELKKAMDCMAHDLGVGNWGLALIFGIAPGTMRGWRRGRRKNNRKYINFRLAYLRNSRSLKEITLTGKKVFRTALCGPRERLRSWVREKNVEFKRAPIYVLRKGEYTVVKQLLKFLGSDFD